MALKAWDEQTPRGKVSIYQWNTATLFTSAVESPYVPLPDAYVAWLWIARSAAIVGSALSVKFYPTTSTVGRNMFMLLPSGSWTDAYTLYEGSAIAGLHWRSGGSPGANFGTHLPGMNGRLRVEVPAGGTAGGSNLLVLSVHDMTV